MKIISLLAFLSFMLISLESKSQFDGRSFQFYNVHIKRSEIDSSVVYLKNYCDSLISKSKLDAKTVYSVVLYHPQDVEMPKKWFRLSKKIAKSIRKNLHIEVIPTQSIVTMDNQKVTKFYVSICPALTPKGSTSK